MFYIYSYISLRTGLPYYIGKGKGNRAYRKHKNIPVPKDRSRIIIMEDNLTELGAFALERRYIRWYGRRNDHTGILINRTDGGEGSSGLVLSKKVRKRLSELRLGRPAHNKGIPNPEQKERWLKNNPMRNPEIAKKVAEKNRGKESPQKIQDTFKWYCKQCGKEHIDRNTAKKRKAANFCNKSCAASFSNARRYNSQPPAAEQARVWTPSTLSSLSTIESQSSSFGIVGSIAL
jgi:hypothetical protein